MKYKYAKKNNFLEFRELSAEDFKEMSREDFRKMSDEYVDLDNYMTNKSWTVNRKCAETLQALDGDTNPCEILKCFNEKEVEEIIGYYKEKGWLYNEKRITPFGFASCILRLFTPNIKEWHRVVAKVLNGLFMFLSIPMLGAGLYILLGGYYHTIHQWYGIYIGLAIGLLSCMIFPELFRASACIAYGGNWLETGIRVKKFIADFYVVLDYENVENTKFSNHQIKFIEAEYHLALAGLFLLFLKTGRVDEWTLIIPAVMNALFAVCEIFSN